MPAQDDAKLAEREWYIQGFNAVPLFVDFAAIGGIVEMPKYLGYGYDTFLAEFKNDFCEFHYPVPALTMIYNEILERHTKDPGYMPSLIAQSEEHYARIEDYLCSVMELGAKTTDEELIRRLARLLDLYVLTAAIPHAVEGFSLSADVKVKELLLGLLASQGRQKELPQIVTKLTMPTRRSFLGENEDQLKLLLGIIRSNEDLLARFQDGTPSVDDLGKFPAFWDALSGYVREYYWIRASYAGSPWNTAEATAEELSKLLQENASHAAKTDAISAEEKEALIAELGITGKLLILLRLSDVMTSWHDDRKKMILKCATVIDMYVGELASRTGMPHALLRYLTPDEFTQERLRAVTREELEERRKGFIVVYDAQGRRKYSGDAYRTMHATLVKSSSYETIKEIPGLCASVGRAIGKVMICKSMDAIKSFEEGRILVASMTRPEYLPAMKKAAAIVTDEGGVTCHAAIVSRELGKPCLIGTRNASSVLRDGDLVEVKANHGQLVIIERAPAI
jgi:phosphohistidine swiveling domain-containing protein